jgi:hypothetical protein
MRKPLVATSLALLAGAALAADYFEDFDIDGRDVRYWGADDIDGHGSITSHDGLLVYTVSSPTSDHDGADRLFARGRGTYNADWEVILRRVHISASPSQDDENCSFGINITSTRDAGDSLYAEMYASHLGGPPMRKGFYSEFFGDDESAGESDTSEVGVVDDGRVRIAYNWEARLITCSYDADVTDGINWTDFATYGISDGGGANGNANWQMQDGDEFVIEVYGYSTSMTVASEEMYGDDLEVNGVRSVFVNNMAVVGLKAPKTINLKAATPALTKKVKVLVQNRGDHPETLRNATDVARLVGLTAESLGACAAPTATLSEKTLALLPRTLKPKQQIVLTYEVTFDCANDPAKSTGGDTSHSDFRWHVQLDYSAFAGETESDALAGDDVCPRVALGPVTTSGKPIIDRGCGGKGGADVLTDVVQK